MKVTIVFDPDYGMRADVDVGDAFWLVESSQNRALATRLQAAGAADPNSAVFRAQGGPPQDDDVLDRLDDVDVHHPNWTTVRFVGVRPRSELRSERVSRGLSVWAEHDAFVVERQERNPSPVDV
jgi:hypothetical protein